MLLNQPKQRIDLEGIAIREGAQPAGTVPRRRCSTNLLVQHLVNPVTLKCITGGRTYSRRIVPGDIHIIPAETEIEFDFLGQADLFLFAFDRQCLDSLSEDHRANHDLRLSFHFSLRDSQIVSLVHALREELRSGCARGQSYVTQLASTLLRYIATTYSPTSPVKAKADGGLPPNRLRFVLDHIHSNIRSRLLSKDLAKLVQMSPQHFGNLFRQSTGRAPYEYVIYERIERGKRLLSETTMPIMEIALEVGFAHHSHFADTFRHITGMSPKHYRLIHESYPPAGGNKAA